MGQIDAAIVNVDNVELESDLASPTTSGYRGLPITGIVDREGLKDMEDFEETISKQGATTGITDGEIDEVLDDEFTINIEASPGDSGGPVYRVDSDPAGEIAQIAGVIRQEDSPGSDIIWSSMMESIETWLDVTV